MTLETASMKAEGRALRSSQLTRILPLISLEGRMAESTFFGFEAAIRQQRQASTT